MPPGLRPPSATTLAPSKASVRSASPSRRQQSSTPHHVEPIIAFYIFAAVNVLAALYAPIQDCDEVFNYWEPTHYLRHGYGLQTWEYSPEYSIRSWFYIVMHAVIGKIGSLMSSSKTFEFYFIRVALGLACAYCESRLFTTIGKTLNPRLAIIFMTVMLSSSGMFHAAVAYLPSSFSMYTNMLGIAAFMDWRGGSQTNSGIMWFGVGGVVGWPFAAALVIPFLIEEIILATITKDGIEVARRFLDGSVRCMIAVTVQLAVDAFFYHKLVVVPWNIVFYNIFSGSGRGPNIFGTEPPDFYIRNLLLNFNVWFVLAFAAGPLLVLQYLFREPSSSKFTLMRSFFFVIPFYMWLAIFSAQAHKEERFMYPAYPFLALNAAIALHAILAFVGTADPTKLMGKIPPRLKLAFVSMTVVLAVDLGVCRTIGMITAYRAPLQVYSALQQPGVVKPEDTVCLGKEWYRFPSSFFLPNEARAKFIRSEFDGLLPGEFSEAKIGFGFFPGTWLVPAGMNDRNIADLAKLTDVSHCSYLVDSYFPGAEGSVLEPNYALDDTTWEEVRCSRFLDTAQTSLLGRSIWLPELPFIPQEHRRKWGRYCLLRRRVPV